MRRSGIGVVAGVAAVCAIVVAGCGGDEGGPITLNYMSGAINAHTNEKAAKECSQQSGGKYTIEVVAAVDEAPTPRASCSCGASPPATRTST